MKKILFSTFFCAGFTLFSATTQPQRSNAISFKENKGQVSDQHNKPRTDVLYSGSANGMVYHLKKDGLSYQLYRVDCWKKNELSSPFKGMSAESGRGMLPDKTTIYRLDINWLNANKNVMIQNGKELKGYDNYYLEVCPNGVTNVRSYEDITYKNIYNGIDLHYYSKDGNLKYDYIVAPGVDYKQIQLKVEGAGLSFQKDGSLLIETPLGKILEQAPQVYQNGKQLKSHYVIKNNTVSFEVENYNANYELIIDPITRLWSTYFGGTGGDENYSCVTDASGNVYTTGVTTSNAGTVIATVGSHQSIYGGGMNDGFLVKFNSGGMRQWSTYYGGALNDQGISCAIDPSGNIYMAGSTGSSGTVMASPGSHQSAKSGGSDAFLVKFNTSGIRQWGTYYGGALNDECYSCVTNAVGDVYISGRTQSNTGTVIASSGSHQDIYGGGGWDAYLVKFGGNGVRQWGTYYGGTGDDYGYSCTTDALGNLYLCGRTDSNTGTVIASSGSHQNIYGGGGYDAFLIKFNSVGFRQWGTYYGGVGNDDGLFCATDTSGNIYIVGNTNTNTGTAIATLGSHQNTHGGVYDAYLVKFNSSGIRQWCTYYGGMLNDYSYSCTTDISGNVYITGYTASNTGTVIATIGSYQDIHAGGGYDAYLVKFNGSGLRLWGSYYGGAGVELGAPCSLDSSGNIYIAGWTDSNMGTLIATAGSHQSVYGGGFYDAFLVKFGCTTLSQPSVISGAALVCAGSLQTYSVTNDPFALNYSWSLPGAWSGSSSTNAISATAGITGIFTITANDACGTSPQQTLNVVVNAQPTISASTNNTLICTGQSATLTSNGANTYTWSTSSTGSVIAVSPTVNTVYTVTGTDTNGCQNSTSITQSVSTCASLSELSTANSELRVYPNPNNGEFTIFSNENNLNTEIYNCLGDRLFSGPINLPYTSVDLRSFANGIYFLKISGPNEYSKIIKVVKNP